MSNSSSKKYIKYEVKNKKIGNSLSDNQKGGNMFSSNKFTSNHINVIDEVYFWSRQMYEHMKFVYLGLEDKELKAQAENEMKKWLLFTDKTFDAKGVKLEVPDKIALDSSDYQKLGDLSTFNFVEIDKLLNELRQYELKLIETVDSGLWIGWLFSSYYEHILLELDTFQKRIHGNQSFGEDLMFYTKMSKDHVATAEKLTSPSPENKQLEEKLREAKEKTPHLNGTETEQIYLLVEKYLQDVDKLSNELKQEVYMNQQRFVITRELVDHVGREQKRALLFLKKHIK